MFLVVLLDVVQELLALKNLDVGGKADDEAASAFDAVDGGPEAFLIHQTSPYLTSVNSPVTVSMMKPRTVTSLGMRG